MSIGLYIFNLKKIIRMYTYYDLSFYRIKAGNNLLTK